MALIAFEDFSHLSVVADLIADSDIAYLNDTTLVTAHPFSGKALNADLTSQELRVPQVGFRTGTRVFAQFWYYTFFDNSSLITSVGQPIFVQSSGTSDNLYHLRCNLNAFGIQVLNGAGASLGTFPHKFKNNAWNYVELELNATDPGTAKLTVNGDVVFDLSGDFLHTTSTINTLFIAGFNERARIADLIVMDGSGSEFNAIMGEMRLETALPTGDGGTAAWTPTSGANYTNIDDAVAAYDDDTTSITSATANQVNLATHATTAAPGATEVLFAGIQILARDDDVSPAQVQGVAQIGATEYVSTTRALATAYKRKPIFWALNPDTGLPWLVSEINATEWGVKAIA